MKAVKVKGKKLNKVKLTLFITPQGRSFVKNIGTPAHINHTLLH